MIFKKKEIIPNYIHRFEAFNNSKNYYNLIIDYLKIQPHTLYNMGHFYNFIKNQKNFEKVLSIGIDPIKEYILFKECNFKQIDVFDIDANAVEAGNKFWKNQKDLINIKYYCKNILVEKINYGYSAILLFQMDYVFSDKEISNILKKSLQAGIDNCYVITPSLFNVNNINPINIFIYDVFYFVFYFFKHIVCSIFNFKFFFNEKKKLYYNYKRTKLHLTDLFNKNKYIVFKENVIINNNGSFNIFHFKQKKNS